MKTPNCIVVLGPTASGKTKLAVRLAHALNGEVISMDSRQVYKGLDIGSGKDLMEYEVDGIKIPYHLISIAEAHTQFFLHHFIEELRNTFEDLLQRGKLPVLCGGTGLYLDALRKDFSFTQVPEDPELRKQLEHLDKNELKDLLHKFPEEITKHVDLQSKKRLVRGIEVARWLNEHPVRAQHPDQLYRPYYLVSFQTLKPDSTDP